MIYAAINLLEIHETKGAHLPPLFVQFDIEIALLIKITKMDAWKKG